MNTEPTPLNPLRFRVNDDPSLPPLPEWTYGDGFVTIRFAMPWLENLAAELIEWEEFSRWTNRDDCKNWRRSPVARENRRESIVYGNCLTTVKTALHRQEIAKLIRRVKAEQASAAAGDAAESETT